MPVRFFRWLSWGATTLLLAGCFQAELGGPVAGGEVTVTDLRTGALVLDPVRSADQASLIQQRGQDKWNGLNDVGRLINLGNFFLDAGTLGDDRYYRVTVSGGLDTDADHDRIIEDGGVGVSGSWNAIMLGSDLKAGGSKVSLLTEALYQAVLDDLPQLSDVQLRDALDELARTILTDTTDDGSVDYADVLNWTVLFHIDNYQLEFDAVDALKVAVATGASDVAAVARAVVGDDALDAEAFFADNVSTQVIQRRCVACHVGGGVAPSQGSNLVFVRNSDADHVSKNHQIFIRYSESRSDLTDYVTRKAQGMLGHGGGTQLSAGSTELENFRTYLQLID